MSDHDETLLDEDCGDEEYDLGNDEEEALLADDNDFERLPEQQSISKGEEETDDVLDLGVTDALDDLEGEEENIHFKNIYDKSNESYNNKIVNIALTQEIKSVDSQKSQCYNVLEDSRNEKQKDLREKLRDKSSNQREYYSEKNSRKLIEDDDFEETKEKRNRFPTERVMITPKINQNIPDSLENILTIDHHHKSNYRSRERVCIIDRIDKREQNEKNDKNDKVDKSDRKISWGRLSGRYDLHQSGRYYHSRGPVLSNQQGFRGQPVDSRPSFLSSGVINNIPVSQHHSTYSFHNSQDQVHYRQPIPNSSIPRHHSLFIDPNHSIAPSPFVETMPPQNSRINGPRIDYGLAGAPLAPISAHQPRPPGIIVHPPAPPSSLVHHPPGPAGPPVSIAPLGPVPTNFNCSTNQPQFSPGNQTIFPNHSMPHIITNSRGGTHPNNQGPPLSMMSGSGPTVVHISGNQGSMISVSQAIESYTHSQANLSASHQNIANPVHNQPLFENRLSYPELPQFETHLPFDSRNSYNSNPSDSQINSALPKISRPLAQTTQQVDVSNVPIMTNVSNIPVVPAGHKILINPHFRGNPSKSDAHNPTDKFVQALRNASGSTLHQKQHCNQQIKSDDPYSYFSDVWQENKSQKSHVINSRRSYSPENSYSKSNYLNKYKSESQWTQGWTYKDSHTEKQDTRNFRDTHRDKESSPKSRNDQKHSLSLSKNCFQNENDTKTIKTISQKDNKIISQSSLSKEPIKMTNKRSKEDISDNANKKSKLNETLLEKLKKVSEEKSIEVDEDEESDPEMREYRRKMEEQKRLREKILREKENRRKLAAMQKRNPQIEDNLNKIANPKQASSTVESADEDSKSPKNLLTAKRQNRSTIFKSLEEKPLRIVRTVLKKKHKEHSTEIINSITERKDNNVDSNDDYDDGGKNDLLSRIVLNKTKTSQKCLQKKSAQNNQKIPVSQTVNANRQLGQIRQLLAHSQRIVVPSVSNQKQQYSGIKESHQLPRQKIVMTKSTKLESKKITKSNIVKIDNLAASTTELQIRKMCHGIGSVESIYMGDGNATIVFKTQSAAMVFQKKYQRKMLDLSLIKVQLLPQSAKSSVILLKNPSKE